MKISLLQTDICWESPQDNLHRAEELISGLPATDLIVLPEMFTTGFCVDPTETAEVANGNTLAWMSSVAVAKGAAVGGSISVKADGRYYNRFYFVKPDGTYATYDKRHLFFAGEDEHYTAGTKRVIVEHCGFRILLQVCYDLRFPVFSRNQSDYDMILYIANWPATRISTWNTLLRARAIENQCYVAGVNRTGNDPNLAYNGSSALIGFLGEPIATASLGREEVVQGEADLKALKAFRVKFPVLQDADAFTLMEDEECNQYDFREGRNGARSFSRL